MSVRVVLAVPGELAPAALRLEDKFPFPLENLGAGYLAAGLTRAGIEAVIADGYAARWSASETAERVATLLSSGGGPAVLGLSVLQKTAQGAREVARLVREKGYRGPIVLGGWAATMSAAELLAYIPEATLAVRGEAEDVLPSIVVDLAAGKMPDAPGVARRGPLGIRFVGEAQRASFEGLIPRHDAFLSRGRKVGSFPVQGSRGCAWGLCSFCSTAGHYGAKAWRMRSVGSLVEELSHPAVAIDQQPVFFVDDEFFGPSDEGFARAHAFAERVVGDGIELDFGLDCLVQSFEPGLFEKLRKAGLRRVFLGLESGSAASLRLYKKGFSVAAARRVLSGLAALEIEVISGYILFHPYATLSDVRAGVDFLADDLAHDGNPKKFLSKLSPEAGTELFVSMERDGLLTGSFPDWGFRFADERVGELYRALSAEAAPLCEEYTKRRLAGQGSSRDLTEAFLRSFEAHYRAAGG